MADEPATDPPAVTGVPTAPPRKNLAWLWVFLTVGVLAIAAITTIVAYNIARQLKPEQLAAARALWKLNEPSNYEFTYTTNRTGSTEVDRFRVRVRNREVVHAELNDQPLESRLFYYRSMSSLLGDIKRFMDLDAEPGRPRTFTRAVFDEQNGQLRWYVRRVMGSRERIEITVSEVKVLE